MPFRLPRYMGVRNCKAGDTTCVAVHAIGHGESLGRIEGTLRAVSLPEIDGAATYTSPFAWLDINYTCLFVPFNVAITYTKTVEDQPHVPITQAEWDQLAERLILSYGLTGSNQYYGGNPDAAAANQDLNKSVKKSRGTADSATDTDEAVAAEAEVGLGPHVMRLYNSERWLTSTSKLDLFKNLTDNAYGSSSDSDSLQDCVFQDNLDIDIMANVSGPGFVLFVVTRYKVDAVSGFACSYGKEDSAEVVSDADRRRCLNAFFAGDQLRIRSMLSDKTSVTGDYIRTLLFGGDVNINPVTDAANPVLGQLWTNDNPVRKNDVMVGVKLGFPMSTPYTIEPTLL